MTEYHESIDNDILKKIADVIHYVIPRVQLYEIQKNSKFVYDFNALVGEQLEVLMELESIYEIDIPDDIFDDPLHLDMDDSLGVEAIENYIEALHELHH